MATKNSPAKKVSKHGRKVKRALPKYASVKDWLQMSGMRMTTFYDRVGKGEIRAIKIGNRTLVDVEHGFAWMAKLPSISSRKRSAP